VAARCESRTRLVDLLVSKVKSNVSQEVQELMWDQNSVLRYVLVQHTDGDGKSEGEYEGRGGIIGSLEDIQLYVLEKAPILWELCKGVAVGNLEEKKTSMVIWVQSDVGKYTESKN